MTAPDPTRPPAVLALCVECHPTIRQQFADVDAGLAWVRGHLVATRHVMVVKYWPDPTSGEENDE